jgi:Male sterility protein
VGKIHVFMYQAHKRCCLHAQATAEVLALVEALPQLRAFVHVSTAFVNGHQPQVWVLGAWHVSASRACQQQQHLHPLDMRRDNE